MKFAVKKKKGIIAEIKEWVNTIFVSILLALFIMTFIIQAFKIPSGSMKNTFLIGDHLFVGKFIYGTRIPFTDRVVFPLRKLHRRDIIVFRFPLEPDKDFIKRCMALPGDTVEMRDKKLYVNGELQDEPYVIHADRETYSLSDTSAQSGRDNFGPVTVPDGKYFVMGDNRDASYDSRFWGFLERKYIKGKALFVYWPLNRIRIIR